MMNRLLVITVLSLAFFSLDTSGVSGALFGNKDLLSAQHGRYRPRLPSEQPLDFMDKMYSILNDLNTELKSAAELLDAMEADLGNMNAKVSNIKLTVIPSINITDQTQDSNIVEIESHLDLVSDILDDLHNCTDDLENTTDHIIDDSHVVLVNLSDILTAEINQDGAIANLHFVVFNFKEKLLQHFDNNFDILQDEVLDVQTFLDGVHASALQTTCESGVVVFGEGETGAEYIYQHSYKYVPMITYAMSCYVASLDERPDQAPAYGSYSIWEEPNRFGFTFHATPGLYGVRFTAVDHSFGDTVNRRLCLNVLVCSGVAGKFTNQTATPAP